MFILRIATLFFAFFVSSFSYGEVISVGHGEYIIKQPVKTTLQQAQKVLDHYDQLYRVIPGIDSSTVKSTGKNYKIVDQVYKANYTFGLSIPAEIVMKKISRNEVQYQLLKSDRIRALSGDVLLQKINDQEVLVIHKIDIQPRMPMFLKSVFFRRFKKQLVASSVKIQEYFVPLHVARKVPER